MQRRYITVDVFTDRAFGGNPLGVVLDAGGLSTEQMQAVAREFNYSETTFVLPPADPAHDAQVRIFTVNRELPFAGHPNVGTAFALAREGQSYGRPVSGDRVIFEEKAGLVPITITRRNGSIWCELSAPTPLSLGPVVARELLAAAVSLSAEDVVTTTHPPQVASVGLPFIVAELRSRAALERARVNGPGLDAIKALGVVPDIHLYVRSGDEFDLRTRMFAPYDGVPEDPATGSANCALAALLTQERKESSGAFKYRIAQGVEMGRPSVLEARSEKRDGAVSGTWIGGASVLVSEGTIEVGG